MTALCEGAAYKMPPHAERWSGTLTTQEARIAERIARGMENRQIAGELVVAVQTVKFHVSNLIRKVDGSNRQDVVRWWIEHVETAPADAPDPEPDALKALVRKLWAVRSSTAVYQLSVDDRALIHTVLTEEA